MISKLVQQVGLFRILFLLETTKNEEGLNCVSFFLFFFLLFFFGGR